MGYISGKPAEVKATLMSVLGVLLYSAMTNQPTIGNPEHGVENVKLRPIGKEEAILATTAAGVAFVSRLCGAEIRKQNYGEKYINILENIDKIIKERYENKPKNPEQVDGKKEIAQLLNKYPAKNPLALALSLVLVKKLMENQKSKESPKYSDKITRNESNSTPQSFSSTSSF